ncbi:MAG TPA: M20/M25/M40 family metallo-hydrolase [Saprospiraceae bacterium]|nr:M20/M25/M40 family metallo-hydrolase [Saprospiraceae bacterium]
MMKKMYLWSLLLLLFHINAQAQATKELPEYHITKSELEAHMRFLASDDLEGRRTGSRGSNIAARYIASYFESYGLQTVPGAPMYYQPVQFEATMPPKNGNLKIDKTEYALGKDFLILAGDALNVKTSAVFANYGLEDDYNKLDVKGKIVFVLPGTPDDQSPQVIFTSGARKRKLAAERGAVAVFELYRVPFPWNFFVSYFGKESIRLAETKPANEKQSIVYGFFKEPSPNPIMTLQNGKSLKAELKSDAGQQQALPSQNVIGIIEGTDPVLKDEYILLTAHYDHVGVGEQGGGAYTAEDSIFNGARDNAFGTVAVLAAARAFAIQPPKRSVIFLAVTGEEIGLLGSEYYAENPLIPHEKVVFNLNCDGAGYNNTGAVSIFGFGRTGTDDDIRQGLQAFGLEVIPDPAPEQNLFDRSDNVSFAIKGIPALTFSPGFNAFDQAILQYYHQVGDNPDTIDFDYLHRYCQSYIHTARLIGDRDTRPFWKAGDKYEKAGQQLYKR